jgi:hypothetical protein
MRLGDWMAAAGPWQGESEDEILELLREDRRRGGRAQPPETPPTKATEDVLKGATWHGESAAEVIQIIRDVRELDDPTEGQPDRVESQRSRIVSWCRRTQTSAPCSRPAKK